VVRNGEANDNKWLQLRLPATNRPSFTSTSSIWIMIGTMIMPPTPMLPISTPAADPATTPITSEPVANVIIIAARLLLAATVSRCDARSPQGRARALGPAPSRHQAAQRQAR
jgi:hypothetical protein